MAVEKKNRHWKIWAAGVLITGVLGYAIAVPSRISVQVIQVKRGKFEETIRTDGIVRSKERHTITAFAIGDIKRVSLKVGDPVKKGTVITEIAWDADYRPVKSPINGVVSKVYRETAGPIERGSPIVEIVDPDQLEVVASLLTNDALRVKIGNPVRIEGTDTSIPFNGTVTRVSRAGFVKQSALGVEEERTEVITEIDEQSKPLLKKLGDNFHVDMTIQVGSEENVLKLPIGAIFRDGEEWAVYRVDGNRAKRRRIQILKRSSEEVVIGEGLTEGESFILYPGDLVKEGSRISIQ